MFLHIEEEDDVRACNGSYNEIARIAKRILGNRIAAASTNGKKLLWYVFDGRWVTVAKFQVKHELSTVVRDQSVIHDLNLSPTTTVGSYPYVETPSFPNRVIKNLSK